MALEVDAEIDHDTALRQLVTCRVKARAAELGETLTDADRADLVAQVVSFHGDGIDALLDGAIDRELAEDADEEATPTE